MKFISDFKEIFSEIIYSEGKESNENIISKLEKIEFSTDDIELKIEKFKKPFPCPLYFFSFLSVIKTVINLKQKLFQNYDYYLETYLTMNQKKNKTHHEENLLEELKELLYRMDDITGKIERVIPELFIKIKEQIISNVKNYKNLKEHIYIVKITSKDYSQIYPVYENLIQLANTMIDELKNEKGLFKLTHLLSELNESNS